MKAKNVTCATCVCVLVCVAVFCCGSIVLALMVLLWDLPLAVWPSVRMTSVCDRVCPPERCTIGDVCASREEEKQPAVVYLSANAKHARQYLRSLANNTSKLLLSIIHTINVMTKVTCFWDIMELRGAWQRNDKPKYKRSMPGDGPLD